MLRRLFAPLALLAITGAATAATPTLFPPNHLFVASFNTSEVFEFAPDGTFLATYDGDGLLSGPEGIAFGPDGLLYVASANDDEVQVIDGANLGIEQYSAQGQIDAPNGLTFGPLGDLFVSSRVTDRVVCVNDGDVVVASLGAATTLSSPRHLAFSPDGVLHVVSNGTNEVLRFSAEGDPLSAYPLGSLNSPTGIAFSPEGLFLVGSYFGDAIRVAGKAADIVEWSISDAQLDGPYGVTVGPDGLVYAASDMLDQVVAFDGSSVTRVIGDGEGMVALGGVAFSPFVFEVKLSGRLEDSDGESTKLAGTGTLVWSPGSSRVMLHFEDDAGDPGDVASKLGGTMVLHGQEGGTGTDRVFAGAELPGVDKYFRVTNGLLRSKGKIDANGFYKPKKITGTISRTGVIDGAVVFRGKIKTLSLLN